MAEQIAYCIPKPKERSLQLGGYGYLSTGLLTECHNDSIVVQRLLCVGEVGKGFVGRARSKTLKWVVVASSVMSHIRG